MLKLFWIWYTSWKILVQCELASAQVVDEEILSLLADSLTKIQYPNRFSLIMFHMGMWFKQTESKSVKNYILQKLFLCHLLIVSLS